MKRKGIKTWFTISLTFRRVCFLPYIRSGLFLALHTFRLTAYLTDRTGFFPLPKIVHWSVPQGLSDGQASQNQLAHGPIPLVGRLGGVPYGMVFSFSLVCTV